MRALIHTYFVLRATNAKRVSYYNQMQSLKLYLGTSTALSNSHYIVQKVYIDNFGFKSIVIKVYKSDF